MEISPKNLWRLWRNAANPQHSGETQNLCRQWGLIKSL